MAWGPFATKPETAETTEVPGLSTARLCPTRPKNGSILSRDFVSGPGEFPGFHGSALDVVGGSRQRCGGSTQSVLGDPPRGDPWKDRYWVDSVGWPVVGEGGESCKTGAGLNTDPGLSRLS